MPSKNIIRVSEFEKLYYDDTKPFKQKHWTALCNYLENVNKKEENRVEYFRIINKGIQFTNYVGVIQAGNLTVEILPKVDKGNTIAANESIEKLNGEVAEQKQLWHHVLLQMLKECRLLKVNEVDYANLNLHSNSILDIYIELFLKETESLLHQGLLKQYKKQQGNQTALKGQLLFAKQIAYNSTHQERFYSRYTEYNRDNIFNQILYKTLQLIPTISSNGYLLDKVGRLLLDFPEVANCIVNADTFNRLQYHRKTERYKEAVLISKMLLLNYRPDITGGTENVIAILFDMNKLWEEFVYRRLKKEATSGVFIQRQQSTDFWRPDDSNHSKKIRPDIMLKYKEGETERTIVIDTKWKILQDLNPSDEDLKQMFVYNLYWNCNRSVLLYPAATNEAFVHGQYYNHEVFKNFENTCSLITVNVFREGKLDGDFGCKVLRIITGKTVG